jgi:hypothetical protein
VATLRELRADLAAKASSYRQVTAGVLSSGSYSGVASAADATRQVISSDLGAANLASTSAELPSTAHDFQWVYRQATGEQRRVVKNGYSAYNLASAVLTGHPSGADSSVVGVLTVDRALVGAIYPGETVEVLGRFPAHAYEELPGLHWAIREALAVIHWPIQISLTGDGTNRQDVASTYPWLKRSEQLIRVFGVDPANGYGPAPMSGKAWLEPNGEHVYLHIPTTVASGDAFTAQVRMPALYWVRVRRAARVTATVTGGAVASIAVNDGGAGYLSTDTLTVTITGAGTGATATATRTGDAITSVAVNAGGSGFVQATTRVVVADPTGTWAASTVGPQNDLDEVLPDVDRVTAVAYWQLALRMSRRGPKPQQDEWAREAAMAAETAAPFVTWQNEPPTPRRRLRLPGHPLGRGWRPTHVGGRRWP